MVNQHRKGDARHILFKRLDCAWVSKNWTLLGTHREQS